MAQSKPSRKLDAQYDVVIIGAGINGAGTFRELCLQGLKCLLIDKSDFSSGTSAAPSRLIHGGLKYIETGEFRLVAESTLERNLLLKNARHFVRPLPTYIPATSYWKGVVPALKTFLKRPSPMRARGAFIIKAGLFIYDWYGRRERTMPRHHMLFGKSLRRFMPSLSPNVVALGHYYDALITQPERLVLELVEDGEAAFEGSTALNYAQISSLQNSDLIVEDLITNEKHALSAKFVINAAGPWIDHVNAVLGEETHFIGGNKGSHVLLDHPVLAEILGDKMVYFEGEDGRILLAFVYHGKVLAGSTDIPSKDPDLVRCSDDEVTYFFDCLKHLFPKLEFLREQIVFTYSGIRPLPNAKGLPPGMVSRDHSMPTLDPSAKRPFPVMSLVGGKWTTFRAFSEQVGDMVLAHLQKPRLKSSKYEAIGGGKKYPKTLSEFQKISYGLHTEYGVAQKHINNLINRYGLKKTTAILSSMNQKERIEPTLIAGLLLAEIQWVCQHESVRHLDDYILRRTEIAYQGLTSEALNSISSAISLALGWDEDKLHTEKARLANILFNHHGIQWADNRVSYMSEANL
ncbi:MAG: glycerol-3-phosphate dehydrogenase/oxidase [Hyphomicrobiales bacterium]